MRRETGRELNRILKELRQRPGAPHMAIVSSTSPLKVQVAGDATDLTAVRFDNYSPTIGDTVYVTMGMGPVVIHDKIVA